MRVAVIVGTRPEFVKMSPIIKECEKQKLDFFILHTGQHYSYELDGIFFDQLKLPKPKHNLGVGSGTYAEEVSQMLLGIEKILLEEKPSVVLVEGDTNSVLSGALAASKCHIPIGHLESGLRSYFSGMPEEINRVLVDHCSNYLFAPTEKAKQTLLNEGIPDNRIFVTGNTIVDAIYQSNVDGDLPCFKPKQYILVTLHRQENVDNRERFSDILSGTNKVSEEFSIPILYPIHPRARKKMTEFDLWERLEHCATYISPCDYSTFLNYEKKARLVLTDSGGVQEESCILQTPCVTLRDNTERPETVECGANVLAGTNPEMILKCARTMMKKKNDWANPFGDGTAAKQIVEIVRRECE